MTRPSETRPATSGKALTGKPDMPIDTHAAGAADAITVTVPAPGTEERDFWLEAAEQHGFCEIEGDGGCRSAEAMFAASQNSVLRLMAAAREQGRKDILATASPAPGALADLRALSEAATQGKVQVFDGQPCVHSDDMDGGFTLTFGGLGRTGSGRCIYRFGYAEEIWADMHPADHAEAKANIHLLAGLWNAYRSGALIASSPAASAPPVDGGDRERIVARLRVAFPDLTQHDAECAAENAFPECLAPRLAAGAAGLVDDTSVIEAVAQHLHDEETDESVGGRGNGWTWPEHEDDTGYRGNGRVTITPTDARLFHREAAARIVRRVDQARAALARHATPDGEIASIGQGLREALVEITEAADEMIAFVPGHWHDDHTIRLTDAAADANKVLKAAEQDDLYDDARLLFADLKAELGTTDMASTFRAALAKAREAVAEYRAPTPQGAGETAGGLPITKTEIIRLMAKHWLVAKGTTPEMADEISDPEDFPLLAPEDWWACSAVANAILTALATATPEQAGSRGFVAGCRAAWPPCAYQKDNPGGLCAACSPAAARPHSDAEGRS